MNTELAALAGRLRQALFGVERIVARAEVLRNKARLTQDDDYFDGVALNLHSFYASVEATFEDIARTVDGAIPGGPNSIPSTCVLPALRSCAAICAAVTMP